MQTAEPQANECKDNQQERERSTGQRHTDPGEHAVEDSLAFVHIPGDGVPNCFFSLQGQRLGGGQSLRGFTVTARRFKATAGVGKRIGQLNG